MIRFAAVLVGAAVFFGLEQEFGLKLYLAIPAGNRLFRHACACIRQRQRNKVRHHQ
jgi:hypothetical protein